MKSKLMMLLTCLLVSTGLAFAQSGVVQGYVLSAEDGLPIIGASVMIDGTDLGCMTDIDGNFRIENVKPNAETVTVTYVGMKDVTLKIEEGKMKVVMETDSKLLDEVMVVAYGTQKKSSFTGSASVMKADEISKVQVSNPVGALKGKVSGVQITQNSGQPDAGMNINIRGISSINADNSPLIIMDGSPFSGDLNTINNDDIASLTVLKDAASAALYGARGANGVILITTKGGRTDRTSISFDAKMGVNSRAIKDYDYVRDPAKYYEIWHQSLKNFAMGDLKYTPNGATTWANSVMIDHEDYGLGYNVYTVPEGQFLIGSDGQINPNATLGRRYEYNGLEFLLTPDNWVDAVYKNSKRQEYTFSASGSSEKTTYYASLNYLNNEGITDRSGFERFATRLKASLDAKPWLKLNGSSSYAHYRSNNVDDGSASSSGNAFGIATTIAPIYPLYVRHGNGDIMYDEDAKCNIYDYGDGEVNGLVRPFMAQANPLGDNKLDKSFYEGNQFSSVGSAIVKLPYGFKFTSTNNVLVDEARTIGTRNSFYGQFASSKGTSTLLHTRTWSYNLQQLLNWSYNFGKHGITALLGHEYYRSRSYIIWGQKHNQLTPDNHELDGCVITKGTGSSMGDYNVEGYFGRVQYNFAEKYFGSISYRRDATSNFHPDNRWGNFWSLGGAWLISKEDWFNADWVDQLKIKASYGEQGNDKIGPYKYVTTYKIKNSDDEVSLIPENLGNKNISWEKQGNFNTGVDFSLFRGRLSGSLEYFNRKTKDMLSWFPLSESFGYTGYYANVGDMVNKGIELEISGDIISTNDFVWNAKLNLTHVKNKIDYLPKESKVHKCDGVSGYQSGEYFYGEGKPIFTWHMKKFAGLSDTGEALYYQKVKKYVDENGSPIEPVLNDKTHNWELPKGARGNVRLDKNGNIIYYDTDEKVNKVTSAADGSYFLCGHAMPDVYGGFGTSFMWKGFDVSFDFAYQIGGKCYDSTYLSSMSMNSRSGSIFHKDLLNAWTPENKNTNVPRIYYGDQYGNAGSDRFLISASYLSFQNFTVGYTLPKSITDKIGVSGLRLYCSGDNLCLWSKRKGLDPRQNISGSTTAAKYSPIRTISGGITLTF